AVAGPRNLEAAASGLGPWCGKFTPVDEPHVVRKNFRVVEGEPGGQMQPIEQGHAFRVVCGPRSSARAGNIDRGDGLAARITSGSRIDPEQSTQGTLQRGFLQRLANRRLLDRLTEIDEAARNRPAEGKILALDQNDLVANLDDRVGRDRGAFGLGHSVTLSRASRLRRLRPGNSRVESKSRARISVRLSRLTSARADHKVRSTHAGSAPLRFW